MFRQILAFLICVASATCWAADDFRSPDYAFFLQYSSTYTRDQQMRAYVRGAIDVLRLGRHCSDEAFRNTDRALQELITYGKTTDGSLLAQSNFSGVRESVASALMAIAKEKGC